MGVRRPDLSAIQALDMRQPRPQIAYTQGVHNPALNFLSGAAAGNTAKRRVSRWPDMPMGLSRPTTAHAARGRQPHGKRGLSEHRKSGLLLVASQALEPCRDAAGSQVVFLHNWAAKFRSSRASRRSSVSDLHLCRPPSFCHCPMVSHLPPGRRPWHHPPRRSQATSAEHSPVQSGQFLAPRLSR
jgi:hypothetical protein